MLRSSRASVPRTAIALLLLLLPLLLLLLPESPLLLQVPLLTMYGSPLASILRLLLDPKGSRAASSSLTAPALSSDAGSSTSGCAAALA